MKKMITLALAIITMSIGLLVGSVEAKAYDRCGHKGCTAENTANGTVFCDKHAAEYAKEQGYKACAASGCWDYASKGSDYCSKHTCKNSNCTKKVANGSRYCATHSEKSSTSTNSGTKYSTTKKSSTNKSTTKSYSSKTTKKSSSKSTTKKKYDAYDVYDYDSAQEFADDKYEEFYDYEDDFEDEDEAYDAAEDYWNDHH